MENRNYQSVLVLDFPKEVWTLIFEQFLDKPPNQLGNARLACSAFKNIIDSMPQRKLQQVLTLVNPFLYRKDRLKMRSVSKYCKLGMDMILENSLTERHPPFITLLRPFTHDEALKSFYATFKSSHLPSSNPFLGRSIDLENDSDDGGHIEMLKALLPIMGRWGYHLRTVSLWVESMVSDPQVSPLLLQVLNKIPNTQNLELIIYRWDNASHDNMAHLTVETSELPEFVHLINTSF